MVVVSSCAPCNDQSNISQSSVHRRCAIRLKCFPLHLIQWDFPFVEKDLDERRSCQVWTLVNSDVWALLRLQQSVTAESEPRILLCDKIYIVH